MNQETIIPELMKESLATLAGVQPEDYTYTKRGVKFTFENSMQANYCQIIEYHDKFLVEVRKKTDNILEGRKDLLVSEKIIERTSLIEHFENVTGVYLSYL